MENEHGEYTVTPLHVFSGSLKSRGLLRVVCVHSDADGTEQFKASTCTADTDRPHSGVEPPEESGVASSLPHPTQHVWDRAGGWGEAMLGHPFSPSQPPKSAVAAVLVRPDGHVLWCAAKDEEIEADATRILRKLAIQSYFPN